MMIVAAAEGVMLPQQKARANSGATRRVGGAQHDDE
jgi:hypothetical protein